MTRKLKTAMMAAAIALATTAAPAAASSGLVGRWQLSEGAGTTAADSSGFGDNATLSGGVGWTSGPNGAALSFDGATGRVRVPDAPQLESPSAVSVAAWVARVGSPGDYKYILAKGGHGCISGSYGLYSGPGGGLQFYVSRNHGTTYARSSDAGTSVWDGRWHLAVGSFDGTTIRLYLDGAEVGSGTVYPGPIEYSLSDANDLFVGAYPSCRNENFDGTIGDVRVWNRALSPAEVSSLGAPDEQPPTGGGNPPSTASQLGAGTGSGGNGSGTAAPPSNPPVLRMISISASTLTAGSGSSVGRRALVIAYNDSTSARVTFTILRVQGKAAQAKCIKAAHVRHRSPKGYCPRYIALGRYTHQDRPGRNTVRLPRALTPTPGNYVLDVTPSLNGNVGKTVALPFKVIAGR